MTLAPSDIFVGSIAVVIGVTALLTALYNWERPYQFWLARIIARQFGHTSARIYYASLGLLIIGLGVFIALGFRIHLFGNV